MLVILCTSETFFIYLWLEENRVLVCLWWVPCERWLRHSEIWEIRGWMNDNFVCNMWEHVVVGRQHGEKTGGAVKEVWIEVFLVNGGVFAEAWRSKLSLLVQCDFRIFVTVNPPRLSHHRWKWASETGTLVGFLLSAFKPSAIFTWKGTKLHNVSRKSQKYASQNNNCFNAAYVLGLFLISKLWKKNTFLC